MNGGTKPDFASDILPLVLSWFAIPNFRACRPDGGYTQTPGPLSLVGMIPSCYGVVQR